MQEFSSGPFIYTPAVRGININGTPSHRWVLYYGARELAMHTLPDAVTQDGIRSAFSTEVSAFIRHAKEEFAPDRLELVEQPTENVLSRLSVTRFPDDFSGCIPDDRHPYWLMTENEPTLGMPVTLQQYTALALSLAAPRNAWVAGLLSDEVLTAPLDEWRPPTSWEIRHVVGENSFTGISGAKAAALVGVTPQNFRKYTASDTAKTRQKMSYAMWHLLLHKLEIQYIS